MARLDPVLHGVPHDPLLCGAGSVTDPGRAPPGSSAKRLKSSGWGSVCVWGGGGGGGGGGSGGG